jgi:hypothetical protein
MHSKQPFAWEKRPNTAAWQRFKRERCLSCIGLPKNHHDKASGKGSNCGTTVDWLIGGHSRKDGCILVTDDSGPEFEGLTERVKLGTLTNALERLLLKSS